MNFSDNYLAFTQASYSDSLKAIQEAANRILELQNEQLQTVVKNAIAPMQSMLDEAARNIFSNLDISKQLSASIGVMKQTISQFSDIIPDENSSTSSNSESNDVSNVQDDICNNIENLISEVPIDPKAKEDIISSNEIRSLRTTNPWTREQKFQLITLILSILTFLLSIISKSSDDSENEYNTTVNITINNNSEKDEQIKELHNIQDKMQNILETIAESENEEESSTADDESLSESQ